MGTHMESSSKTGMSSSGRRGGCRFSHIEVSEGLLLSLLVFCNWAEINIVIVIVMLKLHVYLTKLMKYILSSFF